MAILTYKYTKQNLRAERFVSSSLLVGSVAQNSLKPFKSLNITNLSHATHDLTDYYTDLLDTLQFYFNTGEPPVSDHQKGAALVIGIFIWEVVYDDTKPDNKGTLPGISPDKSTFCTRIYWDAISN